VSARRQGNRIPGYRAYGGVLIVPSLLNQKRRAHMIVDSGAAYCCITPEIARLLRYDLQRPMARCSIASAQGLEAEVPSFRLQSLQVEGIMVQMLEVLVVHFPPRLRIDEVLGVNFLERFRFTLDFNTATLILRARSV
jgi:predicted aspartyl protease